MKTYKDGKGVWEVRQMKLSKSSRRNWLTVHEKCYTTRGRERCGEWTVTIGSRCSSRGIIW